MLRRFAPLMILALAYIAVAACGGDSTSTSPTPGGSPTATPSTPTPVPSTSVWQVSGQLTGSPSMSVYFCAPLPAYYEVVLTGQVNGEQLNVTIFTSQTGTLDFANAASGLNIFAALGPSGGSATSVWQETAGKRDVQGTVVLGADGTGSMTGIVVPPSVAGPGGATTNITLNGDWKCSSTIPSPSIPSSPIASP